MTENDAKTMWCPFVRMCVTHGDEHMAGFNRIQKATDGIDSFSTNGPFVCIGSKCMMWRETTKRVSTDPMKSLQEGNLTNKITVPDFYCGLAGKP